MNNGASLKRWTADDSADLYAIRTWGNGYFSISPDGEVVVDLRNGERSASFSLPDIAAELKERGISLPVLLRFGDILDSRVALMNESFRKAIAEAGYKNKYRGVYPIKVNQQQQVVEEITRFGKTFGYGLEAGSKAELIAALAYLSDPEALIVCNGYKDKEFIDLALYATKLGLSTILVLEVPIELDIILQRAQLIGVKPRIGVRTRLSSKGAGKWSETGGDRSVFGLNTAQVIDVVDRLRACNMLDCLEMLHFHVGSQIPGIRTIRTGVAEAMRIYADLVREGARMGILDIGGGLAVDYDGSHTNFASSCNYTVDEYCADVVEEVMAVADETGVPHPMIVSESGRAVVAYHSVLLLNIMDVARFESHGLPERLPDDADQLVRDLLAVNQLLTVKNVQECYHDALYYRDEIRSLFSHGDISLRQQAMAEQIFWHIASRISREVRNLKYVPEELVGLENALADIYYANFSVFQSLPDSWAIDQLFPIMPIHRLNEYPSRKGILADCTCDSDGKIDRFIDLHDVRHTLPLHPLNANEEYVLGVFLVGAYQETLGDLHNLFGDTNVVGIRLGASGSIKYTHEILGDSVSDVLSYVEYENKDLIGRFRDLAERAVREQRITAQERHRIMDVYEAGLRGYTYFEY